MNSSDSNFDDFNTQHQDSDWRTFRYVADEMNVDERAAFENELADDQSLRETVARMVGGFQSVDASFENASSEKPSIGRQRVTTKTASSARGNSNRKRRSVAMVASVVAALALLVGGSLLIPGGSSTVEASEDLVAEMWVDSIGLASEYAEAKTDVDFEGDEFELMASSWLLDAFDETELLDGANGADLLEELLDEPSEESRENESLDDSTDEEAERV